nr:helix-turn-helix transcriptional regulator [Providencia sp. PROV129]
MKVKPSFCLFDPLKNAVRRTRGEASMNGCSCALRWPEASFTGAMAQCWHRVLSDSHLWLVSKGFIGFISLKCAAWKVEPQLLIYKDDIMTGFELKLWRRGMNWEQERAAEELGVSVRSYKRYEKAQNIAKLIELAMFALSTKMKKE